MAKKNIIFIKLGGSVITDKNTPKKANLKIIQQLAGEIYRARKKTEDLIILGHGSGSFAHQSAAKYKTIDGIKDIKDLRGMAEVKQDAMELNLIINRELIKAEVPAFTLAPSSFLITGAKKILKIFTYPILNLLNNNLVPVVYGDVITDKKIGCTIYSTEQILNELATVLSHNFTPKLIIEVGKTDGVYDGNNQTIPEINSNNYLKIRNLLKGSRSKDVTGGMNHKVSEAVELAKKEDISTLLISASSGNLEKAILGKKVEGTLIKA